MTTELISPGSEEFGALFRSFAHSVFRLETLQVYRGQRDLDLLGRFLEGRMAITRSGLSLVMTGLVHPGTVLLGT